MFNSIHYSSDHKLFVKLLVLKKLPITRKKNKENGECK